MRNPIDVLENLNEKSKDKNYKFQRLYRNLYNPDFYWLAYKNIFANKGSMTPGVNGITMDNMNDGRIEKIITSLKDHSYKPNPAKRIYIAKKNSNKMRPLGIPSGDDKLIQEVVRMILASIYEQNFSNRSHGFRPKRSCHTALKQIQNTFTGVKWFVEGDIEACFDSFDHHVIMRLLRSRIDDEPFINLMWKFMKAGYMEQWEYHGTYDGVPQGSGISPIISNIYLNELDEFFEAYKAKFDVGTALKRKRNPEYVKLNQQRKNLKKEYAQSWNQLNPEEKKPYIKAVKEVRKKIRTVSPLVAKDESYKTIQYTRYADDFLLGIIGSKADAERVKSDFREFLEEKLKLKMSDKKTKITHSGDKARFLGYDITVTREQSARKRSDGIIMRSQSYTVKLLVPREKWVNKLLEYQAIKIKLNGNGKERYVALHRGKFINRPDIEILAAYNAEIRGLYNFYSIANNAYKIGRFANLMKYSMLKTFAGKYKTTVNKIKKQFNKGNNFTVEYQTKSGRKSAVFYNKGFSRKQTSMTMPEISILPEYEKYSRFNSLKSRVKLGLCEICNRKSDDILLHQVKKLKDLKGDKAWERLMIERRRRTLAVCPRCHSEIHA